MQGLTTQLLFSFVLYIVITMLTSMLSVLSFSFYILICMLYTFMFCFVNIGLDLGMLNILYNCLHVVVIVITSNILEEIICYIIFSIMVDESIITVTGASGGSAAVIDAVIDWTTYRFPQPIELTGLLEKFNGGVGFARWQEKMRLWLTMKSPWLVVEYEKPAVDQAKAETIKAYAMWVD